MHDVSQNSYSLHKNKVRWLLVDQLIYFVSSVLRSRCLGCQETPPLRESLYSTLLFVL